MGPLCILTVGPDWKVLVIWKKVPLLVVFGFFFACYRSIFIPISEANYARPREFKKKKDTEKNRGKSLFPSAGPLCILTVDPDWKVFEIGKRYPFLVVFRFFFACYRSIFIPISEANYARPREFKKNIYMGKTEVKANYQPWAHCET